MRWAAAAISGAVLLAVVVVQLSGNAPDAHSLLAKESTSMSAELRIVNGFDGSRASKGRTAQLSFDTSPEDLDGLSTQQKTAFHEAEAQKMAASPEAKVAAGKAADAKAAASQAVHKPSLEQIRLDTAAAKEGDALLAEDRKVAAEELMKPEKGIDDMISTARKSEAAREAAFQANLKKMAASDKAHELTHTAKEAATEKKIEGFVTSSDAAFEKTLAKAVKEETAGHNVLLYIYVCMYICIYTYALMQQ